jgi:hypothetical protein
MIVSHCPEEIARAALEMMERHSDIPSMQSTAPHPNGCATRLP